MPVTRFTGPAPRRLIKPDYARAIGRLADLPYGPADPRRTVAIAVVRRGETDASAQRFAWSIRRILRWFNEQGIDPLAATVYDVQAWWSELAGYAPRTRNQYHCTLRIFYQEAIERDLVIKDPTRKLKREDDIPVTPTPALTYEQASRLIRMLEVERDDPERAAVAARDASVIGFMLRLCLRESEVQSLVWGNIGLDGGRLVVSFIGKGRQACAARRPTGSSATARAVAS